MRLQGEFIVLLLAGLTLAVAGSRLQPPGLEPWTPQEREVLRSLWLGSLTPLPPDPSNAYGDDPEAAALGHALFFDTRLSANGAVSCATCHSPQHGFQDGRRLAQGIGQTTRRTMPLVGTAYSPWQFWDGRKDSQWAQALGPLENPLEHGTDRTQVAHLIAQHYGDAYEAIFGPLPPLTHLPAHAGPIADAATSAAWEALAAEDREAVTRLFANVGKALAAYERLLQPRPARFDRYVEAVLNGDDEAAANALTPGEIEGVRLFIGEAHCTNCHNGPLFTNNVFHNTGVPAVPDLPEDTGRALGAVQVQEDPFNCLGPYSDAPPDACAELHYLIAEGPDLLRAYKPPSLRNVAERAPFMHAGQFQTLADVLRHYNDAPPAPAGRTELHPLSLTPEDLAHLVAFLHTLTSPFTIPAPLLQPPH